MWSIVYPKKEHKESTVYVFVKCTVVSERIVIMANAINVILGKSVLFEYDANKKILNLSIAKHPLLSLQCASSDDRFMFVGGMNNTNGINVGYVGLVCGNILMNDVLPKYHIPIDIAICNESCIILSRGCDIDDDNNLVDISSISVAPIQSFFKSYLDSSFSLTHSEKAYTRVYSKGNESDLKNE